MTAYNVMKFFIYLSHNVKLRNYEETVIHGKPCTCRMPRSRACSLVVKTDPNSEVVYWGAGKDEIYSYALGEKDTTNTEGYMTCQMELHAPKLMAVNVLNKPYTLYLTPGSRDTLTVTKEALQLAGTNKAYNECLRAVDDYQSYCEKILYTRNHELMSAKTPDELIEQLKKVLAQ